MKLTVLQTIIIILAITLGTQISRWLPFIAFSGKKETPKFVKYLGRVLPPALMGLICVYCSGCLGFFEPWGKLVVEGVEHIGPLYLSVLNPVELFLHLSGEVDLEEFRQCGDEEIVDLESEFGWV